MEPLELCESRPQRCSGPSLTRDLQVSFWIADSFNLNTFVIASSMISAGLTWWQVCRVTTLNLDARSFARLSFASSSVTRSWDLSSCSTPALELSLVSSFRL